ncbi:MAG: M48 family peptidase [Betaproteobacteria bacterium]|nr:M48 family peptidase [Betaproteobacteria bacterium]
MLQKPWPCLAIACFALLGLPVQAVAQAGVNLPALGESNVDELSVSEERRLGRSVYQELMRAGVVSNDPEVEDYLHAQSWRLLQAALSQGHLVRGAFLQPEEFEFFVVRDRSINAFAIPGGYIGVHTGLIVQSQSESELMSVLAHEIGHVTQRHISRMIGQQRQSSGVMLAAAILAAMAAGSSGDAAAGILSLGQTVAVREQLAFSREAEREADRVGFGLMSQAGFDPAGQARLFERLAQASRLMESDAPSWLRTHPLTQERIGESQSRLGLGRATSAVVDSLEFQWLKARLQAQEDRSVDGQARQRGRLLDALTKSEVGSIDQARLFYALAWLAVEARDFSEAQRSLQRVDELLGRADWRDQRNLLAPLIERLRLRVLLGQGRAREALERADRLPVEWRTAVSWRALQRDRIEFGIEAKESVRALAHAKAYVSAHPKDAEAWRLYGSIAEGLSRRSVAHWAAAERYALLGAIPAAIEQLEAARRAADTDFLSLSQIDARLATLRRQWQAEKPKPNERR